MFAKRVALTVLACLASAVLAAPAQQQGGAAAKLPRTFTGTYVMRGGGASYQVTLVIEKLDTPRNGEITFVGKQSYKPSDLTETATGRIDLRGGKITVTLSNPTGSADIDGVFEGTISTNLEVITCAWIKPKQGAVGDLKLTAERRQ